MDDTGLTWHQALAYAVTGERHPDLGRQPVPDVDAVLAVIPEGVDGAHVVPADLRVGIGAAQLAAALSELRLRLNRRTAAPVVADRALSAEERRLVADAPPHHL